MKEVKLFITEQDETGKHILLASDGERSYFLMSAVPIPGSDRFCEFPVAAKDITDMAKEKENK